MVLGSAMRLWNEYQLKEEASELPLLSLGSREMVSSDSILSKLKIVSVFIDDPAKTESAFNQLLQCEGIFGLDIETYGLPEYLGDKNAGLDPRKSQIRLVQIYDGKDKVFIFDLLRLGKKIIEPKLWEHPIVAHNAMFEMRQLLFAGIGLRNLDCSLLADRVINGNRSHLKKELGLCSTATLKDLAKEMLDLDISKVEQISDWSIPQLSSSQIEYAALDAVLPVLLFRKQNEILKNADLYKSYEILRDAQEAVAKMELAGIGFDVVLHKSRIEKWEKEKNKLCREITEATGRELNLRSSKQVDAWLKEALKQEDLAAWAKTAGGQLSTSTPTFKLKEKIHSIFPKIIEYRGVAKKLDSFGENLYKFIDPTTNRLYGSFSLGTTATGRMASSNPNMQNMPREDFRDLFIAKEGYVFIGLDYSQQELRVAALVTGDKELLGIYKDGGDVHVNTAAAILNIPKEAVTKPQRQLSKAVIFGLLYGQGAAGLARYAKQQYGVEMTEAEAEIHRRNLFKAYRGLREWQRTTGDVVKVTGKIKTKTGRLRDFNRELKGYQYTAALNFPIQGAAAEITLTAITRLTPFLSEECRLVNVIHDEILLEVKESWATEIAEKAKRVMEKAFLDIFPCAEPYLNGLIEAKIGKNWKETK